MGLASGEHPPAPSPCTGHSPRELFLGGGMQKHRSITMLAERPSSRRLAGARRAGQRWQQPRERGTGPGCP